MGKIISVSNQKGGVGKTTTTINLASFMASMGKKILIVDMDPQGNAGFGIGINAEEIESTVYEILIEEIPIEDAIFETEIENLFLMPSNIHLSGAQVELLERDRKEYILRDTLSKIKDQFNYIFIDCPPSLGILTLNSLVAADSVLIPLQCEYYALEGLSQLLRIIALVQEELNRNLKIEGVLLTMFDSRTNLSNQVVNDVRVFFKDKVFKSIIPRNVRLSEAPSFGKPIGLYDSGSAGSISYEQLAGEVVSNG